MSQQESPIEKPRISDVVQLRNDPSTKLQQEGALAEFAQPTEQRRYSNTRKRDNLNYAKMEYEHRDFDEMERVENEGGDYHPPPIPEELIRPDLDLRVSENHLMIDRTKDVTSIIQNTGGSRGGFWGRKKG